MILIGLTGGIGCGKSFLTDWLIENQVRVIDTDLLARAMLAPGQPALVKLRDHFGDAIFHEDGSLNRPLLGKRVFEDQEARTWLESWMHPMIRSQWKTQVETWAQANETIAVVVIPLLFETGVGSCFDRIVCMACSAETQQQRLIARGWSPEHMRQRLDAQWSLQKKMEASHHVIWTDTTELTTLAQWQWLQSRHFH